MAGGEAGEDERPSESGWYDDDKEDGKYPIGFRFKPTTAVKRSASSAHTGAPNKRTSLLDGRLAPTRGEGGSGVRMPPVGVGVGAGAAGCHHGPGLPTHWPSARMPNANGQAPGQAPRMSRLRPPHRTSAIAPNSQGASATTTMMPPPNLDPGQPARLPSPQHPPPESSCSHDEGANRHAGVEVTAPPDQFPPPHGGYPYGRSNNDLAQRTHLQQSSSAVEKAPAAEKLL